MPSRVCPESIQQLSFRLHKNDHAELVALCAREELKIQNLLEAVVLAFIDGDEHVRDIAKRFKELNKVPDKKKFSFSPREAENLLDVIEGIKPKRK